MKLFCRKYGSGPPLIILHGLYGSSDNWVTLARKISNTYTIYLPDQRNHGQSPHNPIHDYNSMRNDLAELADDLKLDEFFLAGHSMGGKVAASFALKWPGRLLGLLIADIDPFAAEVKSSAEAEKHKEILNAILSTDLSAITSRNEAEKKLSERIKTEKVVGLIMKNIARDEEGRLSWKLNARALFSNLENIMEPVTLDDTDNQEISGFPVLVLKGELSDYIAHGGMDGIIKHFPAAELVEIKNAGHWLHADNPAEVEKNLLRLSGEAY